MSTTKLLLVATLVTLGQAAAITPIQKVLQMMEDMKAKGLTEKDEETVTFKTLMQFCLDTNAGKGKAISDAADTIDQLHADIEKYNSDATTLGKEMSKLDKLIAQGKADAASSKENHAEDEADYQELHGEYSQNQEELQAGIEDLKAQKLRGAAAAAAGSAAGASLIQKMAAKTTMPAHIRQALLSFISTSSIHKLSSKTGDVEEILESLMDKLYDEKAKLERDFLKTSGSFQMLQQTFADQIDQHTTLRNMKAATKKEKEEGSSNAEGDLADTETLKSEDEAYLKDVQSNCAQESSDYEARQKDRAGEMTALNKAIEIISGGAVSGAADKHLPSLVQATSMAQLRSSSSSASQASSQLQLDAQRKAASFLKQQSKRFSSGALAALSSHVAGDPFGKVKKMIQDMVYKLMEEANEEAEQKGFCDAELGKNKVTRDQKTSDIEELTANIDEFSTKMSQLGQDVADLSQRVADTDAAIKEATEIRQAEKAKNTQTITEAAGASKAVKQALDVLNEYYQSKGGAALLQFKSSTGVLAMLEVILSDFARLESSTKSNEATNQAEYDKFMNDSNLDKATAEQQVKDKSEARTEADINLANANKDLESTQAELNAAKAYHEKLKPTCDGEKVSYEDRVDRRKLEIESLKESLKILDEQPIS